MFMHDSVWHNIYHAVYETKLIFLVTTILYNIMNVVYSNNNPANKWGSVL